MNQTDRTCIGAGILHPDQIWLKSVSLLYHIAAIGTIDPIIKF